MLNKWGWRVGGWMGIANEIKERYNETIQIHHKRETKKQTAKRLILLLLRNGRETIL